MNANQRNQDQHDLTAGQPQHSGVEMAFLLDAAGEITYAGASVLAGLSYQPEALVGQSLFDYIHPEDKPTAQATVALALKQAGVPVQHRFRLRRQAGRWLPVQATITNFLEVSSVAALVATLVVSAEDEPAWRLASEEKFAVLFELAPDAIFLAELDSGLIVDANPAAVALMGKSREQLIGTHFTALHPSDHLALAQELFGHPFPPGESMSDWAEIEVLAAGGVRKVVEIRGCVITLNDRDYVFGSFLDVTQRKQAELALRESEARFRAVWETASDAMVLSDPEGTVLMANPAYAALYGYPLDQVVGHNFAIIFPPEARAWAMEQYQTVFNAPEPPPAFDSTIQRADGEQCLVESHINFINQNGQRVAMLSTIRDITARKNTEDQLRQLSQAVEQSPAAIIITDVDGYIEYVNPAFTRNTGYSFAEVKGRKPNILQSGLTPPHIFAELWDTVLAGETYRCQFHNRKKTGEQYWDDAVISPIKDEQGQITHLLGIQQDITEYKQFEQERANLEMQLRQTQRLETIGTLAGGIAHDFNNILTPILGFAELALMRSAEDNPVRPQLEHILRAAHRAKDLVQQILTFSRQSEHERVTTELQPLVKEVLKLLRPSLPTTIEIRQEIDPTSPSVLADPSQIHQVLMNLCTNAFHAMQKSGGLLTIELGQLESSQIIPTLHPQLELRNYVRLTVSDTGHGMDPATLGRIFEPFFTTKPMGKGTGLGLSVVHGIVKNHGGAIIAHSVPGQGTTFELYFPVASPQTVAKSRVTPPPAGHKERILLVDDEPAIVELLSEWLTNAGYRVTSRTSSLEALALFQQDPGQFDVVITDLTMPHITGLSLAKALKTLRPNLPIVLITGYGDELSEINLSQSGVNQLVMKPIIFSELGEALRVVLTEKQK